jgi:hypothetical protein
VFGGYDRFECVKGGLDPRVDRARRRSGWAGQPDGHRAAAGGEPEDLKCAGAAGRGLAAPRDAQPVPVDGDPTLDVDIDLERLRLKTEFLPADSSHLV